MTKTLKTIIHKNSRAGHLYKFCSFCSQANGLYFKSVWKIIKSSTIACGRKMVFFKDDQWRFIVFKFGEMTEIKKEQFVRNFSFLSRTSSLHQSVSPVDPQIRKKGRVQDLPIIRRRPAFGNDAGKFKQFSKFSPITEVESSYSWVWKISMQGLNWKAWETTSGPGIFRGLQTYLV